MGAFFSTIFNVIRVPFGWLIRQFYSWTGSYLVAIILFAIVLKIVLFPFGIKQQKNSQKQAKLRPKENVIRKKYAGRNDRATQMKMNQEIQELYKKENFSPFSGCLPMLLQMLILLAVYAVVRSPLTFSASLPTPAGASRDPVEVVKQTVPYQVLDYELDFYTEDGKLKDENNKPKYTVSDYIQVSLDYSKSREDLVKTLELAMPTANGGSYNFYSEINIIRYLKDADNREAFVQFLASTNEKYTVEDARALVGEFPELELFEDFSLGTVPALSFFTDSSLPTATRLTLLIPLLNLVTAYLGQFFTKKFTYQPPAATEQQSSMKMMNIFLPLFSLFISFQVPLAVSIYWIIQNILNPAQQYALSKMFKIP
ncbi:MAG: membrane protein insertase YidC, partial [Clostridia bacterium]|nr:membrane protein insertase YidC [Clostridia bacterium]